MKNLALELGLKTDATESEIQDKIKNLKLSLETAEEEKKKVELEKEEAEKKKTELAAETKSLNEIITAMQKQMNELFESMKTKEEAEAEKAADEAVEMGIKKGIIPTALKDVYKKRFKNDRKAFELEMSLRVPSVSFERKSINGTGAGIELSASQIEMMKKAKMDHTDPVKVEIFLDQFARTGKGV